MSVLKEWVELHGKPMKVMHDGGKEFTSTKLKNFLNLNGIKDKQIPKGYPQEQGKVESVHLCKSLPMVFILAYALLPQTSQLMYSLLDPLKFCFV